jgi:hypothetical protein
MSRAEMERELGYEVTARQYAAFLHHARQPAGPGALVQQRPQYTRGRAHQVDTTRRFVQYLVANAVLTAKSRTVRDSKNTVRTFLPFLIISPLHCTPDLVHPSYLPMCVGTRRPPAVQKRR